MVTLQQRRTDPLLLLFHQPAKLNMGKATFSAGISASLRDLMGVMIANV
jgi:hypothetical protein